MEFAAGEPLPAASVDRRRLRRMISNRESARRSRMRKQRHLEDLRSRVGRLRLENRALADRIAYVSSGCIVLQHENDQLQLESAALHRRLSDIRRIVFLRQLHKLSSPSSVAISFTSGDSIGADSGGLVSGNEQMMASLS